MSELKKTSILLMLQETIDMFEKYKGSESLTSNEICIVHEKALSLYREMSDVAIRLNFLDRDKDDYGSTV
jgi:hypothetical protein